MGTVAIQLYISTLRFSLVVLHFQSVAKFYFVASAVAIDLGDDSTREGGLDMSLDQIGDESCGYC